MSDKARAEGRDFAKFLGTLTPEEIANGNAINYQNAKDEFAQFCEHFARGSCYLCNRPLTDYSKESPCPHWLLRPTGFKKTDLPLIAERYGYFQIQSFLRWVANHEAFASNINDLPEEGSGDKLFEVTIRYQDLEWAFSCAESDYQGHATSPHAEHPHYHLQVRIGQRPFINYSDFHLRFSDMDIINIEALRARPGKMKQRYSFGEGMNTVLTDETAAKIVDMTIPADGEDSAPFKIDTFVVPEEGKTILADDVRALVEEAKEKGVTIASLIHKLPNAVVRVVVTPGPGVVEQAPRTARKKKP